MTYDIKKHNLKRGDRSSAVSEMQQGLVNAGYKIDVDGSFGPKTEAALKQFQKDNGLAVDGIFGSHSAGVLYGEPGEAYYTAMAAIDSAKAGSFTSELDKTIADLYGQMANREPFRYNAADDPLYAQYAALYKREGKQAMEDTVGQAAALTGGYGSSYASIAGQSAYNAYLEKLNDVLPQLEQNAYARYQDAGDALMKQYQLASDMRSDEYEQWLKERDWNYRLEQDAIDREQDAKALEYQQAQDAKALEYQQAQDAKAWEYQQEQDAYERYLDERNWQHKLEAEKGDAGLSVKLTEALQKAYPEKVITADAWKILSALYGENTLTGLGYGKEAPQEEEDTSDKVFSVTNQSGDGWVYVAGLGRLSWAELDKLLRTGEVEKRTNVEKRQVTYRMNKQRT